MTKLTKRARLKAGLVKPGHTYSVAEAVAILKKCPPVKFDETVEISMKLGVDYTKADQQVRGTLSLPHGTGKDVRIAVFAKGEAAKIARDLGVQHIFETAEDIDAINTGAFDVEGYTFIATADMMPMVSKASKVLGPKGLMPNPKAGTVTAHSKIADVIKEIKAGRLEFRAGKFGEVHSRVAKISFSNDKIETNIKAYVDEIMKAKPSAAKGAYIHSISVSTTMGVGVFLDIKAFDKQE